MKINTVNGWYRGLGDIVCYAWLGEGLHQAGRPATFYADSWRADLLKAFQLEVTNDSEGAVTANVGYETCIKVKSPLNYLEWIGAQFGLYGRNGSGDERGEWFVQPKRPRLDLPPLERDTGRRASAQVLIFPNCHSPSRTWPKAYFIELGWLLIRAGYNIKIVYEKRDGAFTCFQDMYEVSICFMTAAIQQAELVICNDSGPAHLAGTIGTKAIAIHGMTTPRIYGYQDGVTSFVKKSVGCSGCHAVSQYHQDHYFSCNAGCQELYRTFPEEVFEKAVELLGMSQEAKAA